MVFGVNVPHSESSITVCVFSVLSIHVVVYAALYAMEAPSVLYVVCFWKIGRRKRRGRHRRRMVSS